MIPFSRQQARLKERQRDLVEEETYWPGSVFFNSHHAALQAVLESLGTKNALVPVVLSVNASPQSLAAVLHAGGAPVLVDIERETLQMNPAEVEYVLAEFKEAIVIADRPAGALVNPVLFEITKGKAPVIVDSYHTPSTPDLSNDPGDFLIYEVDTPVCLVLHKYAEHRKKIKDLRDGLLGHWSRPCLPDDHSPTWISTQKVADVYLNQLKLALVPDKNSSYAVAVVADAQRYQTYLKSFNIETQLAVSPLHMIPEVRNRFSKSDSPSYPVAEELSKILLSLPMDITEDQAREVCLRIKEIKR